MCYYVASKLSASEIFQLEHDFVLNWKEEDNYDGYYAVSGFAHPKLPIITAEKKFSFFNWGLIPAWVKDWETAKKLRIQTLNAQSETIDSKPSFRNAVKEGRFCVVPLNGYFEWHHHSNGEKYPFFIYPKSEKFFFCAGLYENWKDNASGNLLSTFTILTTQANARMEKIHNSKKRMPVILNMDRAKLWLDHSLLFSQKKEMLIPFDEDLMRDHPISKLITSRKDNPNQAAVVEKFAYPEINL